MNVGDEFKNRLNERFIIVEKINSKNITVQFLEDGSGKCKTQKVHIKEGIVRNPYNRNLFNQGYLGDIIYLCAIGEVQKDRDYFEAYTRWSSILSRCYSESFIQKMQCYYDCTVSDEWKNFTNFYWWHIENYVPGYHMDKDLAVKGNRQYNAETCTFVPLCVNNALHTNACKPQRGGKLPMGVKVSSSKSKPFRVQVSEANGERRNVGNFETVEEAVIAYKNAKADYLMRLAEEYKDKIDPRVYARLINWRYEDELSFRKFV